MNRRVEEIWLELQRDLDLFEDRREYGVSDFMEAYNLDLADAEELWCKFRDEE